jgi:hypothetical protein
MKLQSTQGLSSFGVSQVFSAQVLSKILYASQASSGHLQVYEEKVTKRGITVVRYSITELLNPV